MSQLVNNLINIKNQKDTYILPENIKKNVTVYGVTGTLEADNILKFWSTDEMKEYTEAEDNQLAAIIDMSDWWDTESNTFYDTIISVPDNNLGIDPFDGNTNFHSITNFYDGNDTVIGTFDATYNKLVADLTLEVEGISYRYIIWWERVEQREEWAVGGSWNRTKYVRIENGEEVDVEDDYISLTTAIKYNWYSGDEGTYDITSSFIEKPIAKYLEFYIYKWGNWERVGKQGFPMLFKNLWLWENYRDNLDINTMQGEEIAVVFDNEYTKMLEQEALIGASFPYWINIDAPFSDNPNDTFTYEGRDEQNNLCSTVTISNTDVTINIIDLEDYDEGTRSYRITYEYDSENDAFIRQEFKHIKDGEERDDDSPDDNVWFWKTITWTLTSQVEPDYYIVGQFVQFPSTPVYINTYEFIYDDNPHWIALSNGDDPSDKVKRFNTIEEMQEDQTAQEGDLAIVYSSIQLNFTEDTEARFITFPEVVVLPEAISNYYQIGLQSVDTSIMIESFGNLSSSGFQLMVYSSDFEYTIRYNSSDGITYTRSTFESDTGPLTNPVDFKTSVKFGSRWGDAEWNDVIGYFMLCGETSFNGLFKYDSSKEMYVEASTGLTASKESVYSGSFYGSAGVEEGTLSNTENLTLAEIKTRFKVYDAFSSFNLPDNVSNLDSTFSSMDIKVIPFINTSNIISMIQTFYECNNLISIPNLDTSNVTDMTGTFRGCSNLYDIPMLNLNNVTQMPYTFDSCNSLSSNSLSNIADSIPIASQLENIMVSNIGISPNRFMNADRSNLFNKGYLDCDQNTSGWATQYNIYAHNKWISLDKDNEYDRNAWQLHKKISDSRTYSTYNVNYLNIKSANGYDNGILLATTNLCARDGSPNFININIDLNFTNVRDMSFMFRSQGLTKRIEFSSLNTSNLTNTSHMFNGCYNLISVPNFDISHVTNMSYMFSGCYNLTSFPAINTSAAIYTGYMFSYCSNLRSITNINLSNASSASYMFYYATNLANVSNITLNDTSTSGMFAYCSNLTSVSNITANEINASNMFRSCSKLSQLSSMNIASITNTASMFEDCFAMTTSPNFNISNAANISNMFRRCNNLSSVPLFNTINATDMTHMFLMCNKLSTVPNFDTSNMVRMFQAFFQCNNLVNVPEFNTSQVTDMSGMFARCNNLSNASIQNIINMILNSNISNTALKTLNVAISESPFYDTTITNTRYQNRWNELDEAGWTY